MLTEKLLEKKLIPDQVIRFEIRRLLRQRLKEIRDSDPKVFVQNLMSAPLALSVQEANSQHYEVPAGFFEKVLGPRMKYSCAYYDAESYTLAEAEEKMLALTCQRAQIQDGQKILELGCGWGSLTLWLAEKYPQANITAVSNSNSQREFIMARARQKNLTNVEVITKDMNQFQIEKKFDRIVSVEMFEHMRNIPLLFQKISNWLADDGKLFVHIFSHKQYSYLFEDKDDSDWMARFFFTGGMMPSHNLYRQFNEHLQIDQEWVVPGFHYSLTSEHWLKNMDQNKNEILKIFEKTYGTTAAPLWVARWRIFFMACAELWGWKKTSEWQVSHYLFRKKTTGDA